jgi:hypothetical protein
MTADRRDERAESQPQSVGERMKYRVHRLEVDLSRDEMTLEKFLNGLKGDVVSVLPHVRKPSLAWIYGFKRSVDFVVVVEKVV